MNIVLWFVVGGLLGLVMSRVLSEPGDEHTGQNLTVGLVSATLAGWFLAPWVRSEGGVLQRFAQDFLESTRAA